MTRIAKTSTAEQLASAISDAATLLKAGELVAIPTETVYGLAASAHDPLAVRKIFELKGRPSENPLIVHVASLEMARNSVRFWPVLADRLAQAFWPGPLTLVLPKSELVPSIVTASGDTVGIRWPSHPVARAIIEHCQLPLAAPSANPSGRVSPTTAGHVYKEFQNRIALIVDGGASSIGIESTVLDLSVSPPRILRPGMINAESLLSVVGSLHGGGAGDTILRSPGLLPKHYSPLARLLIWKWKDNVELHSKAAALGCQPERLHIIAHTKIPAPAGLGHVCVLPREASAYARAIYAELHRADEGGAEVIIIEALPGCPEWTALADRLRRAAA
jgi:L-threonylcarbamoyladenylate synthase